MGIIKPTWHSHLLGTGFVLSIVSLAIFWFGTASGQEPTAYKNLKVLDKDISREDLGKAMLQNLYGLGLPRRQREGCLFCHVGSMDTPVGEWEFESDEKETKIKARVMMQMVEDINANYLPTLDGRIDDSFRVTCATCHAGRTDPRPLIDILRATQLKDGVSSTIDKYNELREQYYGAGAYDFRPHVLRRLSNEIAAGGAWDDALKLSKVNEAANPDSREAARARLLLSLSRLAAENDVTMALAFYVQQRDKEAAGVVNYSILDGLGWRIYRQERVADALQVFERNLQLFPTEYIANESLGDALWFSDDKSAGIKIFEAWVEENPEHEMGRRRLLNMQAEI